MESPAPAILQVEDEENDVAFMEIALRAAGLASQFRVAEDGEQAINYLGGAGTFSDRARFPLPALIFLDLKLPKVMGFEVLEWIRTHPAFDATIVIILSTSQQRSDIQRAYALRANSYLVKPSNPLELREIVQLVKRYWLHLNQPTATVAAAPKEVVTTSLWGPVGSGTIRRPHQ